MSQWIKGRSVGFHLEKDNCFYQPLIPNKHMSSISVLNEEVGDVLGGLMTDQGKGAEGKEDSGSLCSQLSREAPVH